MSWRWISIAAMLATLVIAYGALMRGDSLSPTLAEPPQQPGYYLKDAIINETQPDGSPGIKVIAGRIEERRQDGSYVMKTVRIDDLRTPERQWTLAAESGLVPPDSRIVQLSGNVTLRSLDQRGIPGDMLLRADSLAVDTEKNLAYSTSSPVNVTFGAHTLRVKSFAADLKNEKITAESVNGRSLVP